MSNLIVVAFPDENRAAEVLDTLRRLQAEHLSDLDDAAYVTKNRKGKVKLHQSMNLVGAGPASGVFWSLFIGMLFFIPFAGAAKGASSGSLSGKLSDIGIDDNFAKQLGTQLQPGSSAIFILVRKATVDNILPEISKFGGTILQTSLSNDAQAKLLAALSQTTTP